MNEPLVSIRNLTVKYAQDDRTITAVRNVTMQMEKGRTLAVVGESGSGKSTLALALIGLLPPNETRVRADALRFDGHDLLSYSAQQWQQLRGRHIAMIFQDPFSALNPVLKIDYQLKEVTTLDHARELLAQVQLTDPNRILNSYPHQLSGGQRQRVMIAMSLARKPDLLIADEPTTALDVTVQDEIIKLLKKLQSEMKMAMLFVTHNLGLVKGMADDLAVMYGGEIVEFGDARQTLASPKHPYTQGLLRCLPTMKKSKGPLPVLNYQPNT